MSSEQTERVLMARSIYGAKNNRGLVVLELDGNELIMLQPDNAREVALNILRAAEAAETDEFMIKFSRNVLELEDHEAIAMLREMRQFRDLRRGQEAEGHTGG